MNLRRCCIPAVWLTLAVTARPVAAGDAPIHRCHALDGSLVFTDRSCRQAAGTREARDGRDGEALPAAPPPAEDGAVAAGRYARLAEQADRDRQLQVQAEREAEREAGRQRADAAAAAAKRPATGECMARAASGACYDALLPPYATLYPDRHRHGPPPAPPAPPAAPPTGPRTPISAEEAAANARRDLLRIR